MTSWVVFAVVVIVIAVDDVLREVYWSFTTARSFFLDRVRWIVLEKARSLWRGGQR